MTANRIQIFIYFAFMVLVAIAYPVMSYLAIPIGSDPGRVYHFSKLFAQGNPADALSTLEPFLSVGLYGAVMLIVGEAFHIAVIQGISAAFIVLLVGNYLYKRHGPIEAIASILLFASSLNFLDRSLILTPYPTYLLFMTLSIFAFIRYREDGKRVNLFLSSILMSLAVFIFNLAITGISVAFLSCLYCAVRYGRWREEVLNLLKYYGLLLLLLLPWFAWRFNAAGMDFYKNPIHWLGQKYWSKFNTLLWQRPIPLTSEYYDYYLKDGLKNTISYPFILVFTIIGSLKIKNASILIFWTMAPLLPLVLGKLPTEIRYVYGILPPIIILASVGFGYFYRNLKMKYTIIGVFFLILLSFIKGYDNVLTEQKELALLHKEMIPIINEVKQGGVVYFRSYQFDAVFPSNSFIAPQYMKEEDAVAFISWKDSGRVKEVIRKYNIRWLILYRSDAQEQRFNSWLSYVEQNLQPNHYRGVKNSPLVSKKTVTSHYVLYEVKD